MENLNFETALVEASELVKRGWNFASDDLNNTIVELKNINNKIYFSEVNKEAYNRGIWEQSPYEHCGDDESAWSDIKDLHKKGLLFDIVENG